MRLTSFLFVGITITGLTVLGCSGSDFTGDSGKKDSTTSADASDGDAFGPDIDSDTGLGTGTGGDGSGIDPDLDTDVGKFIDSDLKIDNDDAGRTFERFEPTESKSAVDIAFVIDTSSSMNDEIRKVENALEGFVARLLKSPFLQNMQLFVLAGRDDQDFFPPGNLNDDKRFAFIGNGHEVASRNLLGVASEFLKGNIKSNKLELRDDAKTHFVFVSDDDPDAGKNADTDKNPPGLKSAQFENSLKDLDEIVVHGIVCQNGSGECQARGEAYMSLAQKTGGTIEDIRTSDWKPIFDAIADKVEDITQPVFVLKHEIKDKDKVKVYVNKKQVDAGDVSVDGQTVTLSIEIDPDDVIVIIY